MNKHIRGTVLLVEDNTDFALSVIRTLESREYMVHHATNGRAGLEKAIQNDYDVLIVDIVIPGMDGWNLCQQLREVYSVDTPILVTTARSTLRDRLNTYQCGADDILCKPFELEELQAKLDAIIKRHRGNVVQKEIVWADLVVDTKTHNVSRAGKRIILSPICYQILLELLRESPNVVTRRDLEMKIWGKNAPDSDSLRSHIYMLRKAIDGPWSQKYIKTLKGVGLKLLLPEQAAKEPSMAELSAHA